MITFAEYVNLQEGGFINDDKAEEGKSRPKKPFLRTPSMVTTYGVSGGPGGYRSTSSPAPIGQNPQMPTK